MNEQRLELGLKPEGKTPKERRYLSDSRATVTSACAGHMPCVCAPLGSVCALVLMH